MIFLIDLLVMLYSIYLKHQTKVGLDILQLDEFRLMFEEEQEVISKLLEKLSFKTNDGITDIKFAFPHLSPKPLIVP